MRTRSSRRTPSSSSARSMRAQYTRSLRNFGFTRRQASAFGGTTEKEYFAFISNPRNIPQDVNRFVWSGKGASGVDEREFLFTPFGQFYEAGLRYVYIITFTVEFRNGALGRRTVTIPSELLLSLPQLHLKIEEVLEVDEENIIHGSPPSPGEVLRFVQVETIDILYISEESFR